MSSYANRLYAIHFILVCYGFFNLIGKTNGIQKNDRHDNTDQPLTYNLAYFFNTFCLSEKIKDKCIAIMQKQIIIKIMI